MIQLIQKGKYKLIETIGQTKILSITHDHGVSKTRTFAWVNLTNSGEILVASHKSHKSDNILTLGRYRLYKVKSEPRLTDLLHLELFVGDGIWQGYLLPNGLPTLKYNKKKIVPTPEVITKTTI